mgnify:CR=1 FL=1
MRTLIKRIEALEARKGENIASDPAIRQWLGIELTEAERAELAARPPVKPITEQQAREFDAWWHNDNRGPYPCAA